MEVTVVEVCAATRTHWSLEHEKPKCGDTGHAHRRVELHQHDDKVTLPDGSVVYAVSFSQGDPYRRDQRPDYGLYLDPCWSPPWPHGHLKWPDFGVPHDAARVSSALQALRAEVRVDRRTEIGGLGGHGRTGTALACLAILSGLRPAEALGWVRTAYCSQAVETLEQATFVAAFTV